MNLTTTTTTRALPAVLTVPASLLPDRPAPAPVAMQRFRGEHPRPLRGVPHHPLPPSLLRQLLDQADRERLRPQLPFKVERAAPGEREFRPLGSFALLSPAQTHLFREWRLPPGTVLRLVEYLPLGDVAVRGIRTL